MEIDSNLNSSDGNNSQLYNFQIRTITKEMSKGGIEGKKEEFKKYLEGTGAVDQLTKILVQLYEQPQKPGNAVEYIKRMLGGGGDVDTQKLRKQYESAKEENERLKKQIEQVKKQIQQRKNL